MIVNLFLLLIVVGIAAALVWNFVPSVREKVKGWSTVLEAAMAGGIYWYGQASDAIREAQAAGYLPTQVLGYVPYVLLAWVILKRFQSSTPVGRK